MPFLFRSFTHHKLFEILKDFAQSFSKMPKISKQTPFTFNPNLQATAQFPKLYRIPIVVLLQLTASQK